MPDFKTHCETVLNSSKTTSEKIALIHEALNDFINNAKVKFVYSSKEHYFGYSIKDAYLNAGVELQDELVAKMGPVDVTIIDMILKGFENSALGNIARAEGEYTLSFNPTLQEMYYSCLEKAIGLRKNLEVVVDVVKRIYAQDAKVALTNAAAAAQVAEAKAVGVRPEPAVAYAPVYAGGQAAVGAGVRVDPAQPAGKDAKATDFEVLCKRIANVGAHDQDEAVFQFRNVLNNCRLVIMPSGVDYQLYSYYLDRAKEIIDKIDFNLINRDINRKLPELNEMIYYFRDSVIASKSGKVRGDAETIAMYDKLEQALKFRQNALIVIQYLYKVFGISYKPIVAPEMVPPAVTIVTANATAVKPQVAVWTQAAGGIRAEPAVNPAAAYVSVYAGAQAAAAGVRPEPVQNPLGNPAGVNLEDNETKIPSNKLTPK